MGYTQPHCTKPHPNTAAHDARLTYKQIGQTKGNPDLPKATGAYTPRHPWALPSSAQPLLQVFRLSSSLPVSSPPFQTHSVPATNILHTHLGVRWAQTGTRHRFPALKELTVCWGGQTQVTTTDCMLVAETEKRKHRTWKHSGRRDRQPAKSE